MSPFIVMYVVQVYFVLRVKSILILVLVITDIYVNPTPKQPFSWTEHCDTDALRRKFA